MDREPLTWEQFRETQQQARAEFSEWAAQAWRDRTGQFFEQSPDEWAAYCDGHQAALSGLTVDAPESRDRRAIMLRRYTTAGTASARLFVAWLCGHRNQAS